MPTKLFQIGPYEWAGYTPVPGTPYDVQNNGPANVYIFQGELPPTIEGGVILEPLGETSIKGVSGIKVYLKTVKGYATVAVNERG